VADGEEDFVDCGSGDDTVYVEENAPTRDHLTDCETVVPVPPELTDPGEVDESVILGGNADDLLNGTPGPDLILGGLGNDSIFGLDGNDHLEGDPGNDLLDGGNGDDRLQGRKGSDRLIGGEGNDHLEGNFDNDTLEGGNGNDYLEDNLGQNVFSGGPGDDYIQAATNGVRDVIDCGPGNDRADVDPSDSVVGCEDVRR
jgi:Ca2+-binding RTX toxin-like protein